MWAPANYQLTSSASAALQGLTYGSLPASTAVYLAHQSHTYSVSDASASLPDAVKSAGLVETYTRQVNFVLPNGAAIQLPITQTTTFTRSAVYDLVTKTASLTSWAPTSASFAAVDRAVSGYTIQSSVSAQVVDPQSTTFNTTANVVYVATSATSTDATENGSAMPVVAPSAGFVVTSSVVAEPPAATSIVASKQSIDCG